MSLAAAVDQALADGLLGPDELVLSGSVADNRQARGVAICLDGATGTACREGLATPGTQASGTWIFDLAPLVEGDGIQQTLAIYGVDGAGNRSATPLMRSYRVDTVAPQLEVTGAVAQVPVVDYLPPRAGKPVLSGRVSDGSGVASLAVRIDEPGGASRWDTVAVENGNWQYTPRLSVAGVYHLMVEARDLAGNRVAAGPFRLEAISGPGSAVPIYLPIIRAAISAGLNTEGGMEGMAPVAPEATPRREEETPTP